MLFSLLGVKVERNHLLYLNPLSDGYDLTFLVNGSTHPAALAVVRPLHEINVEVVGAGRQ